MGNIEKFDTIADRYDTPERIEIAGAIADEIRTHIENGMKKDAIDYGCGTGLVGIQLLNDFRSVTFIDASSSMVEQVERKLLEIQRSDARVLCWDLTAKPLAELRADYIIVVQTLLHIKNIDSILARLHAALNNDGHLLIVDFEKNPSIVSSEVHNGFEQEELIDMLLDIGFVTAKGKTFYHGRNMFMNMDASLFVLDALK